RRTGGPRRRARGVVGRASITGSVPDRAVVLLSGATRGAGCSDLIRRSARPHGLEAARTMRRRPPAPRTHARRRTMKRQAFAEWKGNLQQGTGTVSSTSGVLKSTPYSFRSRFADGTETNPEELIAAAHSACFSMALSGQLAGAGLTADWI